ncbi:MAG: hypothetical protein ACKVQK_26405 [Burkholderiales bacterium]
MRKTTLSLMLAMFALSSVSAIAQQKNVNIRGTVTAFDGKVISVNSREGGAVRVELPDNVAVAGTKAITMADIKPGMPLGVTTVKRADGETVAIDVRPIPPTAALGLSPFDLQPGSTMNNGLLEGQAQSSSGTEITLNYKNGMVKVLVPAGTPMSQAIPGNRNDIKAGETIFIAARVEPDGKFVAARVQVSTNGVKPTQ